MKQQFIKIPFLPQKKVTYGLIDYRVDQTIIKSLENYGIQLIKTVQCKELYDAVHSHPDMVVHPLGGNKIVVAPNVYSYYAPVLGTLGFEVIKGTTILQSNYPKNIAYNVGRVGKFVIHNFQHTDNVLLKFFEKMNLIKINVRQGYTKCSIAVINEKAIITSDVGIHKEVMNYGIDSLLIEPGDILLPGLDSGFIGGACGYINGRKLGFLGNIEKHRDYLDIKKFLEKYGKGLESLTNHELQDHGTFIPLIELE